MVELGGVCFLMNMWMKCVFAMKTIVTDTNPPPPHTTHAFEKYKIKSHFFN